MSLCEHALIPYVEEEGIFRKSGNMGTISDFKRRVDLIGYVPDDLLDNASPHEVCGLMKQFVRDLPTSLIPIAEQDALIAIAKNKELDNATQLAAFREVIEKLDMDSAALLKAICLMCNHLAKFHHQSKMTTENLALVWAPNLMSRPVSVGASKDFLEFTQHSGVVVSRLFEYGVQAFQGLSVFGSLSSIDLAFDEVTPHLASEAAIAAINSTPLPPTPDTPPVSLTPYNESEDLDVINEEGSEHVSEDDGENEMVVETTSRSHNSWPNDMTPIDEEEDEDEDEDEVDPDDECKPSEDDANEADQVSIDESGHEEKEMTSGRSFASLDVTSRLLRNQPSSMWVHATLPLEREDDRMLSPRKRTFSPIRKSPHKAARECATLLPLISFLITVRNRVNSVGAGLADKLSEIKEDVKMNSPLKVTL